MNDTLKKLTEVFQEVFNDDDLTVTPETTAADVAGWDSLMHVTLVLHVEKAFGIRFSSSEVDSLESVGDLADLIATHLKAR
jgi:acyl carrier protein